MTEHLFQDKAGQNIYLTFAPELFSGSPDHVLVVPIYQGKLLFTCHRERGWELPGGKIEPGETARQATIRETWEETGAKIVNPRQIGEYRAEKDGRSIFNKAIYLATVVSIGERPAGFETNGARLFDFDVNPHQPHFSPYMQDLVFALIQQRLSTEIQRNT